VPLLRLVFNGNIGNTLGKGGGGKEEGQEGEGEGEGEALVE
jgi:hypothetical protein